MKILASNQELYDWLVKLASQLASRNASDLGDLLLRASRTSVGNMSTEFLGESRIAVRRVLAKEYGKLTNQERVEMQDVLQQLDNALERRTF